MEENRIANLVKLIERYQESYYNTGEAEISDADFDLLCSELKSISPDHPVLKKIGKDSVDGFPKTRHIIPMGSQEKAANPEEFRAWAEKINPDFFVVQYKLDGASLELQYEKGKLKIAVTRGDGEVGDEITSNAVRMKGAVLQIPESFSGGIRGEVIMTHDIWKSKYADKANCRNAANGIMRRKDGGGCEDLQIICYDASASENDKFFKNEVQKIEWLKQQGFYASETCEFSDPEEVINYRNEIADKRKKLNFDIDGLVIKDPAINMDDLRRPKPERQIAFKFDPEAAYSILKEVEWSESGATYTPIGIIEPVRLAGTTVQRANLNNPGMIRTLGLKIGSIVKVVKRGEIIPKIEGLAAEEMLAGIFKEPLQKSDIIFPQKCSVCNTILEDAGTRLFCPNSACPKRLHHRLEKWISVLDIRELGDKLLRQLFDSGLVKYISDLYAIGEKELAEFERMGELSATKVIRHINTKQQLPLAKFIAGFDLEGVGELIMEKAVASGFDTLEKLRYAVPDDLAGVHGIGEITAGIICQGMKDCSGEMDNVLAAGVISILPPENNITKISPLKGISFCFTGELKTMKRNQAEEKIKALGGFVKKSVVKDLGYLVTNDPDSGSSKNVKAAALGAKIINEEAFLAIIERDDFFGNESAPQKELF